MAIKNLYSNLPGHLVEFKDGGLQLRSANETAANTKSILILGTAVDGPVNEPVAIDMNTVSSLYGSEVDSNGIPNGATLTKYAKQAYKSGFNDIRCMRVTGSVAQAQINKSVVTNEEEVTANKNLGTVKGNLAHTYNLTAALGPLVKDSVSVLVNGGPSTVNNVTYSPYDQTISLIADMVSASATLTAKYKYLTIAAASQTATIVDDGAGAPKLTVNLNTPVYITDPLVTEDGANVGFDTYGNIYSTDGNFVVTKDAVTLIRGTDYTVDLVAGTITFIGAAIGDVFEVAHTGKSESAFVEESLEMFKANQVFTLDHSATEVTVYANGTAVAAAGVVLDGTSLTVDPAYVTLNAALTCTYTYLVTESVQESIIFKTGFGGQLYNEATVTITAILDEGGADIGRLVTLTKPASKKYTASEAPITLSSVNYPTMGRMVEALKNIPLNNVFEAITDYEDASTSDLPLTPVTNFTGGTNGINPTNNEMFVALSGERDVNGYLVKQGAYQVLENYNVDSIYVAGIYADSKVTVSKNSFHYELALLCAVLTYRTKMTHGFIDMKPNSNTTLIGIQNYVNHCKAYNNVLYMKDDNGDFIADENGAFLDLGWYTSLVVGPEPVCVSDKLGTYYGSPAIAYAALNAGLAPQSAPTNKALPGVKGMRYKFSNKQMDELVKNRMVVFKLKNEGVTTTGTSIPYVVDGCTAGAPGSDYARISTVKIVTEVVDQVREVADPFIGEPNTVEQRNALAALISKRLSYLKEQGVIQYYEFQISASIEQILIGECSIALTLVAPQELRKITTVVALKAAA